MAYDHILYNLSGLMTAIGMGFPLLPKEIGVCRPIGLKTALKAQIKVAPDKKSLTLQFGNSKLELC